MIDYEKLKLAHSLCDEFAKTKKQTCRITHIYHGSDSIQFYRINTYDNCGQEADVHLNLDELIARLKELTKPEPKYKCGQKIWVQSHKFECENVISMHAFEGIVIPCKECDYGLSEPYVRVIAEDDEFSGPESFCFPTRQALIEHQLQYWRSQLEDELGQHVSPYCEPFVAKLGRPLTDEELELFKRPSRILPCSEPDTQSNQPQVDADRWQDVLEFPKGGLPFDADRCPYDPEGCPRCTPCQHKSDGMIYTSNPPQSKCIKCGEMYR